MRRSAPLLLAAALAACAHGGQPAPRRAHDQPLPPAASLPEGPDRDALAAAQAHEAKGDAATSHEQARADWTAAGAAYAELAGRPGLAEWRAPLRHRAAELLLRAQRWDQAAEVASALAGDAEADDAARAMGARLAATAWIGAANAAVKAGQLEKLELGPEKKDGPRPPPAAWKRVVEGADAYLARAAADPAPRRAAAGRPSGPEIALAAAEVQFAYGELEDARRRLDAALDRWPGDAGLLEQAIPLYLGTYQVRGDRAGQLAAVERLHARAEADAAKASPEERPGFAKALESLDRARAGGKFGQGEELLKQQKPADAARAFEAAGADAKAPDAASALHNAAVAWDQAGEPGKAAAVRERLLRDHPDAAFTGDDVLRLAAWRSRQGDHAGAARLYDEFLRRWPESPSRCVALRNVASELDVAERAGEAAARYLAFGRDARCAKADPSIAARALVRAGRLFEGEAHAAYGAAAGLEGVTDPEAKEQVSEAKKRIERK